MLFMTAKYWQSSTQDIITQTVVEKPVKENK